VSKDKETPRGGRAPRRDRGGRPWPNAAPVKDDQDKAPPAEGEPVEVAHPRVAIGVDVGGSGIKAAAVDLDTGELIGLRHRVPTPQPSTPAAVCASIARMIRKITKEVVLPDDAPVGSGSRPSSWTA